MQIKRFLKERMKRKSTFISLDFIVSGITQIKKPDPILESECH